MHNKYGLIFCVACAVFALLRFRRRECIPYEVMTNGLGVVLYPQWSFAEQIAHVHKLIRLKRSTATGNTATQPLKQLNAILELLRMHPAAFGWFVFKVPNCVSASRQTETHQRYAAPTHSMCVRLKRSFICHLEPMHETAHQRCFNFACVRNDVLHEFRSSAFSIDKQGNRNCISTVA